MNVNYDFDFGSGRFDGLVKNNTNSIVLADIGEPYKLVLGKDVVLVLPKDSSKLDIQEGYPTHQESFMPLWYILSYHSKPLSEEGKQYVSELNQRVTPKMRESMNMALMYKALDFLEKFNTSDAPPKKKYKNLLRIVQDNLLYQDAGIPFIEDHDIYLKNSNLNGLIQEINAARRGEEVEPSLVQRVKNMVVGRITQIGNGDYDKGLGIVRSQYEKFLSTNINRKENVYLMSEETIDHAPQIIEARNFDFLINEDEHDADVVSICEDVKTPDLIQITGITGKRFDIIRINENLGAYDKTEGAKASFQPISMMIATHTIPMNEKAKQIQERIQSELPPDFIASHYFGMAREFFEGTAWGKSWQMRKEADIPNIKKLIPLYRIAGDLLPRAIYMQQTGEYPCGKNISEIAERAGMSDVTEHILDLMRNGSVSDGDLEVISQQVERLVNEHCTEEHSQISAQVLMKLGEDPAKIDAKSKIRIAIGDKPLSQLETELMNLREQERTLQESLPEIATDKEGAERNA